MFYSGMFLTTYMYLSFSVFNSGLSLWILEASRGHQQCPEGWWRDGDTGRHCYKLTDRRYRSLHDARHACRRLHSEADLTIVNTEAKRMEISRFLGGRRPVFETWIKSCIGQRRRRGCAILSNWRVEESGYRCHVEQCYKRRTLRQALCQMEIREPLALCGPPGDRSGGVCVENRGYGVCPARMTFCRRASCAGGRTCCYHSAQPPADCKQGKEIAMFFLLPHIHFAGHAK